MMMMMIIWRVFIIFPDAKTRPCHFPIRNATQIWFQRSGDLGAWTTQSDVNGDDDADADPDDDDGANPDEDCEDLDDNTDDPARVTLPGSPRRR